MNYPPHTFTYGFELEMGDVPRDTPIPPELGAWEQSERDIVNLRPPFQYIAADPLGLRPPMGGEINVYPARTPVELATRIADIIALFEPAPTFCCTTHSHVHIRVPGLRDDPEALVRLTRYIQRWQHVVVAQCGRYWDHPDISRCGAKSYMRYDGGRTMPDWMCDNIIAGTRSFDDFIRIQCCGRDGKSRGRPLRFAINTYCMKHIDTVEFRMFRSTGNLLELIDCIAFVQAFMDDALNNTYGGVNEILASKLWRFPEMRFDALEWEGLQKTKHDEKRGQKKRVLHEI